MWRYCCGVPLFVTVSLQTEDMRRRRRDGGGEVLVRGRGVWRKRWSMWLRIMSKKLHKALSQITYQLCAWHYPWSISSVLDQVPHRSAVQVHVHPSAHTHTGIHSGPLEGKKTKKTGAIASLCLSLPPSPSAFISPPAGTELSPLVKAKQRTRPVKFQTWSPPLVPCCPPLRNTQPALPAISRPRVWRGISIRTVGTHPMHIKWKDCDFYLFCICSPLQSSTQADMEFQDRHIYIYILNEIGHHFKKYL